MRWVSHRNRQDYGERPRHRRPAIADKGNGGEKRPLRHHGHESRFFLPGEPIRLTGIYEILHDRDHRAAHEAVMHAGDFFPDCETCRDRVRFRMVRTAPYIFDDEDFEPER